METQSSNPGLVYDTKQMFQQQEVRLDKKVNGTGGAGDPYHLCSSS